MKRTGCLGALVLASVIAVGAGGAWPRVSRAEEARAWYLTTGVGLNHLDQKGSVDPEADLGYRVVAAVGFRVDAHWSFELDMGYIRNTRPDHPTRGPQEPLSQVPAVVSVVFHFSNPSRLEPFVGAGYGVTHRRAGTEFLLPDLTAALKGGVLARIHERLALGLDYTRFLLQVSSAIAGDAVGDDTVNLTLRWNP